MEESLKPFPEPPFDPNLPLLPSLDISSIKHLLITHNRGERATTASAFFSKEEFEEAKISALFDHSVEIQHEFHFNTNEQD